MGTLTGKRALITGGGQGIGQAISLELIDRGCNVAIHYFSSKDGAEDLVRHAQLNNAPAVAIAADLTIESEVCSLVQKAVEFLGGIDILVNNTGDLVGRKYLTDVDLLYWQKVIDINLTSMMLVTREAMVHLARANGASIINLASLAGRQGGHPGSLVYSMAKGAVITWTHALAKELGPKGIRVNAVAPGLILGTRFHNTHTTKESADTTITNIPLKRAGTPEDVARTVAFLASEYDGFINGAIIDVNGGVY